VRLCTLKLSPDHQSPDLFTTTTTTTTTPYQQQSLVVLSCLGQLILVVSLQRRITLPGIPIASPQESPYALT
jgi:hypothetical protein